LLAGTYIVAGVLSLLLWISFSLSNHPQAWGRLVVCAVSLVYITFTHLLLRRHHHSAVAYLLVFFYLFLASGIVWSWGVNTPIGILLFALTIVLAGILLTARHALLAALISGSLLMAAQLAMVWRMHMPNTNWTNRDSTFGDVLAYCAVFIMLALVSWLYNREMERLLTKTQQAEASLLQQKALLELQVKERTAELRVIQLEEMQHMYRFAELGQLGITLLHDLANHITALTLELEGLKGKRYAKTITRATQIIQHLNDMVHTTRNRLHGATKNQTFNIIRQTTKTITFLHDKAEAAGTVVDWQPPARIWQYNGDPDSFSQVAAIIINNAIEAYRIVQTTTLPRETNQVQVRMRRDDTNIIITVRDWGKGVPESERKNLFKPNHSTKKSGLGLGLYIAKQIVEMQFSGTLAINPQLNDYTEFIITLPQTKHEL
jgi:signal transduction histidine kinase